MLDFDAILLPSPIAVPPDFVPHVLATIPHADLAADFIVVGGALTHWNPTVLGPLDAPALIAACDAARLPRAKAAAKARLAAQAAEMRVMVAETRDPKRMTSHAVKGERARRIKAGVGTAKDIAIIQAELALRNTIPGRPQETVAILVDKILHWADSDGLADGMAEGLQKIAERGIDACTTVEAIDALLAHVRAQAEQMLAGVMAERIDV